MITCIAVFSVVLPHSDTEVNMTNATHPAQHYAALHLTAECRNPMPMTLRTYLSGGQVAALPWLMPAVMMTGDPGPGEENRPGVRGVGAGHQA